MVDLTLTRLAGDQDSPVLLVVGPSLGTDVALLWTAAGAALRDVEVVGWDLPGHGRSTPTTASYAVADLADEVRDRTVDLARGRPTSYAGVSMGGAVGFVLASDPGPFGTVAALASAPRLGEPAGWHERAALVRASGTAAMVEGSAGRWFAPGFLDREPAAGAALLESLREVDDESYALACEALAGFDARPTLSAVAVPVLVVAGEQDPVVTPDQARAAAEVVPGARLEVLPGVAHLPPAEAPAATADLLTTHLLQESA